MYFWKNNSRLFFSCEGGMSSLAFLPMKFSFFVFFVFVFPVFVSFVALGVGWVETVLFFSGGGMGGGVFIRPKAEWRESGVGPGRRRRCVDAC